MIKKRIAWNRGIKNPEAYKHLGKYAIKGSKPWNYGLTKKMDNRLNYNRPTIFKKGIALRYIDGRSKTDYIERRRFKREMQKLIFERDNYTCQICGSNKDLQVDHIQSWAKYVELRFEMRNCRTLCAKCHYKITFGKEIPMTVKGWGHNLLRRVNS